jgi:putative Mg2+ transporter-C (MgtC) family protein
MLDWLDIISRFGAATAIGALIGLYFELHQKPTGVRTLGLVALAIEIVAIGKFSFALGVER